MAKRLHLAFGFILLLCLLRTTRTFSGHDGVPWYIGCYNSSEASGDASFKPAYEEDQMTPVYCVSLCTFNKSFRYAAVRNGSNCLCLTQIQQDNSANHTLCNVSCHGDQNIICGGRNASSVYSTAVPLLVSLTITLPKQVKTNTSVTAESKLSIKRQSEKVSNLDRIKQGNQTADDILINWYSRVTFWNKTQHTLHGNQTRTSAVFLFATPGNYRICVEAYNLFSHRKICKDIDVVAPVEGLQFVTVFQGGKKLNLSLPWVVKSQKTVHLKYLTASGSRPRFQFDFGDGSPLLTVMDNSVDQYSSLCSCVTVSHVFKRCGNFTVNVTASNSVSIESVTQPGQVMVVLSIGAVEISKHGRDCIYVEGNVSSTLTAIVKQSQGCAIYFQWNFNDSSLNVTTSGESAIEIMSNTTQYQLEDAPSVSHTFSSSRSFYNVTVVAFNEYSRKETTQKVCLQERLQGVILNADVILKPEVSHMMVSTDKETTKFMAQLSPALAEQGTVRYKLHRSDRKNPVPGGPEFPSKFETVGRYVVFAEAFNEVSRVVSNEIVVDVLEKVVGLSVRHNRTLLLGHPVHLSVRLQQGTNVTYYWDFGEGLPISTFNTSSPHVTYNYTNKGKYKIDLLATNDLGREEKESITVYITNVPQCYPPVIGILGVSTSKVKRSREIRLEADVTVTCSEDRELEYSWTITHASSTIVELEGVSFKEQVLIIPPCMLDYGKYHFQLEVRVKDTVLSDEKKIILEVVPSPLVAVIDGGTTKVVGRKNKEITMDASSSHDPDFPDQEHQIRFQWSCHPVGNKNTSCFSESKRSGIRQNQSVLTFQMDWLLSHDTLQFAVTVSKDSRKFTALQILYVDSKESHLLSANCPQCDKGLINPSVPLVITGLCSTCSLDNSKITYTWEIFDVEVDESKLVAKKDCKAAPEESDQNSGMAYSDVSSARKPAPTIPPLQSHTTAAQVIVGTTLRRPTNRPVTSQTVKSINTHTSWAKFASGSICRDSDQLLGHTSGPSSRSPTKRRHRVGFPGSGSGGGGSGSGGHGRGSGSGGGSGWGTGSGTGTGTGTGSGTGSGSRVNPDFGAGARNRSMVSTSTSQQNFTTTAPETDDSGNEDNGNNNDNDDEPMDKYNPHYTPPSVKHSGSIIALKRRGLKLLETYTATGLKSQNFVLLDKYKYFVGGRTYMVAFKVSDGRTRQKGKATVYFNTSDIPECGVCAVTPSAGVAMETTFQLSCSKWKALGLGLLSYHISYSTGGDNGDEKIYSGYRSVVPFVLPPGLASFNHTVQIYVTVSSGQGTKRRLLRPLRVKVIPQSAREGVSMEEVLLNKTVGKYLSVLQEAGDEQGFRHFITALANSLNRLGSVKNVSSKFHLRIQIREKLLLLIKDLAVNDKNSAFQTCLALQALTARPDELTESSVETASRILQHLGEVMQTTQRRMRSNKIEDRFLLSQEFIQTMTRVTSNLIEASSMLIDRNARMFGRQQTEENVLLRATEAAEKLIKAKLSVQVLGEAPLILTTPNIWVNATQLTSISDSRFTLGDIEFHMPTNLEKQINSVSDGKEGKCYGTMMTVYKENPFFSDMHHTKVGSLSISNCYGEDIEVRNLSSSIIISIPHVNHKVEQFTEEYMLHWNHENNHVINQTEKMRNQVLHIHFRPLSTLAPGFVVKLILTSTTRTDSSSKNRIEYSETSSGKAIDLFLSHEQLTNASGSVNVKVVLEDTAFYRIKSIKKGPSLSYSLGVHWKGCFYWNTDIKDWSTDGCEVMDQSTEEVLFCRCNHLTAFSGAFVYPPNSLTIENLRNANKIKNSPVTLALVISIVMLYLVLLGFCVRADKHDKKKLGAVYLTENVTSGVCQRFQITVQTGHWFRAGTSANVFLTLHGDNWMSDPIELKSTKGKPLFERSSCDVFVHRAEWKYPCRGAGGQTDLERSPGKDFGSISKIHIWHDNSGDHPSWFLEHVIVKNVNNGSKWFFNCNRWLAVDEEDGKVECEFKETSKDASSLKMSFPQHFSKSLLDYHLWFSLFGRPSYSRFSRAQRLTCCVSLLLSFFCVNIAWYRPKTEVQEVLGFIDVTAEGIWIGVLCSIVALPVNLLWVFLFRYSRRSFRHHVKVYPMISEPQTDTTELVSSSVLDQSLETVLILKSIGERKRWFQTVWELDDMRSDACSCRSGESLDSESDSTSLGYSSGQFALGSADRPLAKSHAALLETCEFLADVSPGQKKSLEFEKRSTYSVSLSSSASEGSGGYRSRFSLPHVCVYVAWVGCVLTAVTAGVFTVLFGVSFGWDLSIRWLQSLAFSFLESFLVSQPIMVVAFILYMAYKSKRRIEDEDVDEGFEDLSSSALHDIHYGHVNQGFEDETSREDDYFNPALALRRRQRYLKFLKPPSKSKLCEARNKRVQSRALWNYAIELMVFILFLLVTCLLAASVMSPDVYRLNQSIKKAFIRSEDLSLTARRSVKDAWKEISTALYENSASSSYTPFTILLRESQSLLFGRTTITQYKTDVLRACDQHSGSGNRTACHAQCHANDGAWMSMKLNQTSEETAKQLKEITDSQWINECTREITVEFAVYTPILRAISAATLSVKASFTGNPQCHLELNSFPAFFASREQGYFLRVCKLLFGVLVLYLLQHEFFLAWKMSIKYFMSFWRLTQLLTIAISSLCVMVYIRWSVCLYALLREVETTSQSQGFYYAQLVSTSQDTLQASYSLLLFFLIIRCVYLLRSFRSMARLGQYMASLSSRLLACTVLIVIFMMAFVHTGHLLFGRLHSAFKSFGETFLLVSSFFRLEGVNHFQGPMVEQHPVLVLFYFGLFLIGFYVFMRGTGYCPLFQLFLLLSSLANHGTCYERCVAPPNYTYSNTAAVFVCGIPHSKKRRSKALADFAEDFVRSKLQSLREKTQRRERDSTSDEDEDEEESEDEELEAYENDAPFPMEHVLDEVQDQLDELSLRMDNLMGSELFNDRSSADDLSFSEREEDVEYLYQAEPTSPVSSTGYDSDHSNTSAAKWQLSSSSSQDLSDYYSKYQPGIYDQSQWPPGPEHHANPRPVKFTLGSCSSLDMAVRHSEKAGKLEDPSCSSCYEMDRNNGLVTDYGEKGLAPYVGNRRSFGLGDDDLRSGVLHDGELRGGVLRDGVWHVGDMRDGVVHANTMRDGVLRDVFLPDETRASFVGSFSSDGVCSQDLSSCSSHSLLKRPDPDKEPIRPKTMYGAARTHPRRGHEASALRPSTTTGGSSTEAATCNTPDQELRRKTKKSHLRRTKGLFRSSVVYPGHESFALAASPPLPHRMAHGKESRTQPAWDIAPSPSDRGSLRDQDPLAKPSTLERGLIRSTDHLVLEDSRPNSPTRGLALSASEGHVLTCPDPHVPDAPMKGLLGDIVMNRRLGTEIINDDSPECSSPGDKFRLA